MTRLFGRTLREAPSDAEFASHQLLLRGGFVDQLAAGVYSYLPLGSRVKRRAEQIVREEMDRAGAEEVLLPAIHPVELWERTGRDQAFGETLFVVEDRRSRRLVLAPTHEEVITRLFAGHARSYRDLPVTLYQIQTKFRDEARPRGGLVRVREFTMKDAYSFDLDEGGLDESYDAMYRAYQRIFDRVGIPTVAAEADSGAIGGKGSQEFLFLTRIGEDTVLLCDCGYAANAEKAEFVRQPSGDEVPRPLEEVETPGVTTIEGLAAFLGVEAERTAKAVFFTATWADGREQPLFAVLRGELQVNEVKLANAVADDGSPPRLRPMTDAEVADAGLVAGYASPIGVGRGVRVVADLSITPNPFTPNGDGINDEVTFSFNLVRLLEPVNVQVNIYDLSGRPIAQIHTGGSSASNVQIKWDGRESHGQLAPPGIYLYRVVADSDVTSTAYTGALSLVY